MAALMDVTYAVTTRLFGPNSAIPWWGWLALLAMIIWGLLTRTHQSD